MYTYLVLMKSPFLKKDLQGLQIVTPNIKHKHINLRAKRRLSITLDKGADRTLLLSSHGIQVLIG